MEVAMATLTVAFDLKEPRFRFTFKLEFDDTELPRLAEVVSRSASGLGVTVEQYLYECVVSAPDLLRDENPEVAAGLIPGISAWLLQQPTEHPKWPGLIGDYIVAFDFMVVITSIRAETIDIKVRPTLRADIAGTA
jgi:hypothetical protein